MRCGMGTGGATSRGKCPTHTLSSASPPRHPGPDPATWLARRVASCSCRGSTGEAALGQSLQRVLHVTWWPPRTLIPALCAVQPPLDASAGSGSQLQAAEETSTPPAVLDTTGLFTAAFTIGFGLSEADIPIGSLPRRRFATAFKDMCATLLGADPRRVVLESITATPGVSVQVGITGCSYTECDVVRTILEEKLPMHREADTLIQHNKHLQTIRRGSLRLTGRVPELSSDGEERQAVGGAITAVL